MKSILLQIREAARECSNMNYRLELHSAASAIQDAVKHLLIDVTEENLRALNGAWAHGVRVLKNVPPEGEPAPLAGAPESAKLAA